MKLRPALPFPQRFGCVVFWNVPLEKEQALLAALRPFSRDAVSVKEKSESFDEMSFRYAAGADGEGGARAPRRVERDEFALLTADPMEKLTLACAMRRSPPALVLETRPSLIITSPPPPLSLKVTRWRSRRSSSCLRSAPT